MKILHTSDWHLGRTFHGYSLREAALDFIDELIETVRTEGIKAVLISGDVYDNATPATDTIGLFDRALNGLVATGTQVIISSGNHDSARRLGFGSGLFARSGVHIVTDMEHAWTPVIVDQETVRVGIYSIPYLNPRHYGPILGTAPTHEAVLAEVAGRIVADMSTRKRAGDIDYGIIMAHAFVTAGYGSKEPGRGQEIEPERTDSERDIRIGGVDAVPASIFDGADYVALGHLHGRQKVSQTVRYSGSPLAFSFSEERHIKGAWLLDLNRSRDGVSANIEPHHWQNTLSLKTLCGTLDELLHDERFIPYEQAYCRIYLRQEYRPPHPVEQLRQRFENIAVFEFQSTIAQVPARALPRLRVTVDPRDMCAEFYEYVRDAPLSETESTALTGIIDRAVEAEEVA